MKEIIGYKLACCYDSGEMTNTVVKEMKNGWHPFGGIGYSRNEDEEKFVQALVKYEEEPVKKTCHNYTE